MKTMQYCLKCRARRVFTNGDDFRWYCAECGIAEGVEPILELKQEEEDMKRTEWTIRKSFRLAMLALALILVPGLVAAQGGSFAVDFDRTCTDPEEGDVTVSMVWTSDLDGEVGTGGAFTADLSEGLHAITITCTDSNGNAPTPLVIAHTVAIDQPPVFGGAVGGGAGLPADGGCSGTACP